MVMIRDKGTGNISYYVENTLGLSIDFFTNTNAGYIKSWSIYGKNINTCGDAQKDLIYTLKYLVNKYNLNYHTVVKRERVFINGHKHIKKTEEVSNNVKDILIVFVKDLNVIRGFLHDIITTDFRFYVQVLNFIEFRPIDIWDDTLDTAIDIYNYGQFLIDNIFIPDNYFYITPNQVPRKHIKRACKDTCTLAQDIFPKYYSDYLGIKHSLFGGFYYMPRKNKLIEDPIIGLDLTSAYIYCLLIEKHCSEPFKKTDPESYEYYLDNPFNASIGTYIIKYSTYSNKINCYKDVLGNPLLKGEHEVTIKLTNIDLKLITQLVTVYNINCIELKEAKLDYLPKPIQKVIVDEFIKKVEYKKTEDKRLKVQKSNVNGIYGDTIKRLKTEKEFKIAKTESALAPQWGIFTTAYCKKLLLSLGLQVEGWILSATDSVYCLDTPKNRELVEIINNEIRQKVKEFCDKFGYDFE